MTLHRVRDRDYLQAMKRAPVSAETREALEEQDVCHHCKFLFPPHLLSSCRFVSDRQAMPRSCEGELDLGQELGLQKARASQRFVAKHRNSLTGYARVNEEYVCGRKYCSGCLKDNYGKDWMKANNGLCPFCLALCSCTRCLRNEKISKLKAFFLAQGGDLAALHLLSPLDHLPARREDPLRPKSKPRRPAAKWKRIAKEKGERGGRGRGGRGSASKEKVEEETERWESTAEKEVAWAGRRGARRGGERTY